METKQKDKGIASQLVAACQQALFAVESNAHRDGDGCLLDIARSIRCALYAATGDGAYIAQYKRG